LILSVMFTILSNYGSLGERSGLSVFDIASPNNQRSAVRNRFKSGQILSKRVTA
jgi:hypothetical protein